MAHKYRRTGIIGTCALLVGCVGAVETPDGRPVGPGGTVIDGTGSTQQGLCALHAQTRIWRLNDKQYVNAVQDLFSGVAVPPVVTPGRESHEFVSLDHMLPIQDAFASQLSDAAFSVAGQVVLGLSATSGNEHVTCASGQAERECAGAFIDKVATRAFRRPLESVERDELLAVYDAGVQNGSGFASGVELVTAAILQAPSLMYRTELGAAGGTVGKEVQLTAYELASAVSFLFLDSLPDDELWETAVDGSLTDPAVLTKQVDRLLTLERVQKNLSDIVAGWTGLPEVLSIEKTETERSGQEFTDQVRASMYDEAWRFVDDILWNAGTASDLFTSRQGFLSPEMASFYDIDHPTGSGIEEVELPVERTGLLARAGLITSMHYGTNPEVFRGHLLRETFLCGELQPPPPTVDIDGFNAQYGGLSTRERIAVRAAEASCSGCHSFMDELGIAFDTFGGMGQVVSLVNGVAADPAGQLTGTDVDGPFEDLTDLSARLADSKQVRECVAKNMLNYALGRFMKDKTADTCAAETVAANVEKTGGQLAEVFRELVKTAVFQNRIVGGK